MFAPVGGFGGLASRMLNRHPAGSTSLLGTDHRRPSMANSAPASASSSYSTAPLGRTEPDSALRFAQSFSSMSVTSSAPSPLSPLLPAGFSTAPLAKRSALVADPKIESLRKEISQLTAQELQIRTKQEWNFGSQFLEKYGYKWEEDEEGEVVLTRDVNRQRIRIRFRVIDDQTAAQEEEDDGRDIADPNTQSTQKSARQQKRNDVEEENEENSNQVRLEGDEPPKVSAGKPIAIQVSRLDLKGEEVAQIVFYCEAGPENSIIINGLGGEDDESWGVQFDSLSPPLKDKIIDYLCELEIAGDVSKYAREYAANLANTNIPSLNLLQQFFEKGSEQQ